MNDFNRTHCDPFSQLPINGGRPGQRMTALESATFNPGSQFCQFTDTELDAIYGLVCSRRRWWNFWTAVKVLFLAGFLVTTFVLLPLGIRGH